MKCKKNINLKEKMDEKKVYELFRLVSIVLSESFTVSGLPSSITPVIDGIWPINFVSLKA